MAELQALPDQDELEVYCSLIRPLWISLFVQCSYSVLFGSSPCWLDLYVSTPCDSITAAVLITMWLDHCVSTPCESNTAVVTKELGSLCLAETPQPDLTRWKITIDFGKERVSTSPAPQMVQGSSSPLGSVQPGPTG